MKYFYDVEINDCISTERSFFYTSLHQVFPILFYHSVIHREAIFAI